jgi:DHA1 family bicyclomycin/chloramphenicol resistance-like MFS transporter
LLRGASVLLRQRSFLGHTLTYSAVSAAGFIFITVGADLYGRLFGLASSQFGALWSGLSVSYVVGAMSAGYLSRRLGSRRTTQAGIGCNFLATGLFAVAAFALAPNLWLFSGSLGLLMVANGVISPLALAGAVDDHPALAGVAAGLSSAVAMLLSMVSAIATGVLYDGTARPCALLMIVACLLAWQAARMARRAPKYAAGS